jgi:hypothetical protein
MYFNMFLKKLFNHKAENAHKREKVHSEVVMKDQLNALEIKASLKPLNTDKSFNEMLQSDHGLIYVSFDWSGQEQASRHQVYTILIQLGFDKCWLLKPDLLANDKSLSMINDWLLAQMSGTSKLRIGGYGELLFIDKGKVVEFIRYPAELGFQKTQDKIEKWKHSNNEPASDSSGKE